MKKVIGFILVLFSFFFVLDIKVRADCGFFHGICGGTCTGGTCQVEYVNLNCVCVVPPTAPPPTCYKNGRTCSRDDQCCSGYCAETTCATRPVATNTPTSIPCDIDGNNVCNTHNPDCVSTCMSCDPGYVGARKKSGECYTTTTCRRNLEGPCYEYENIADWMNCGYCPPNSDPTPTPFCQQYICYEMNTIECPYANFGGCANGIGHCDNCGGVDCGTCSGGATTPVPTQASCTPDCINPTVSSCITTTCYNATCLGNCYQYCYGMMPGDCSCAADTCVGDTCIGTCGDICQGTKVDDSLTYCGAISRQYSETPQTTGTVWSRVEGCTSYVDKVFFPTWNTYNGQDDIVWYSGTKNGGNWEKYIDISQHQPTLGNTIAVHVYDNGFCRPVGANSEFVGGTTILLNPKTCSVGVSNASATQGKGVRITTMGNAHINPGSDVVRSFVSMIGNSVIPGGVTYDYGGRTGINAVSDGNNYYELFDTRLDSINSNTSTSSFVVHAPPGVYRIHCDLPTDLNGNYVKCSGNPNCSVNGGSLTCNNWKSCSNTDFATFTILPPPSLTAFTIRRASDWGYMPKDTTNRSQTCDLYLADSTLPRRVVYVANVYNPAGYENINTVEIRWLGNPTKIMNMAFQSSGSANSATYTVFSNLEPDDNKNLAYGFEIRMTNDDGDSSGWVSIKTDPNTLGTVNSNPALNTERQLKIWDCQVPVTGTLYNDISQSAMCASNWSEMLVKLSPGAGFNALKFTDISNPSIWKTMSVTPPADYFSSSGAGLIWGKSYISVFNNGSYPTNPMGDLLASGIKTKIADLGKNPNSIFCPTGQTFDLGGTVIDPYSSEPGARIVFSFIEDQESWYQVLGAGVKSRGGLEYGVPVTAPVSSRSLTLGNSTLDNGLVSGISFTNTNGNNENEFGLPNNWWVMRNTNDLDSYNYNYFYNNFLVKAGVGVTGTDWVAKPADGIYFVKNDLSIDSNFTLANPNQRTMMVIVNGDINIAANVTRLDGIYMADGNISVGGTSVDQLNINGMLYAGGSVRLNRGFTDKTDNNTTPAVKVNYSPGLIFNLGPGVLRVLSGWREE